MLKTECTFEIKRLPSEYLRGLAITFVVLGHILGGTFGVIDTHITSILGIGGVTIFLLLSGYGLYQSYRKNGLQGKAYWDKKIEKVFWPYAVITVIFYIYMLFRGNAPGSGALVSNILCVDYTRTMDGTMWYMSFLLIWYLAFFCVFFFKGPLAGKIFMLMLIGYAFQNYWLKDIFKGCAWQFSTNALAFPLGVALGYLMELYNRSRICDKWKSAICLLVRIGIFAGSLAVLLLTITKIRLFSYWVCGVAMFFVLYTLLSLPKSVCRPLKWLGANSFMIYLIEGKLIDIWGYFHLFENNLALYLLSYAAASVVCIYLYRYGVSLFRRIFSFLEQDPQNTQS